MPIYNKLVRDRIPEIIQNNGQSCSARPLKEKEFVEELKKKADEELNEYLNSQSDQEAVEELADLLEIVYTLADQHGYSVEDLEEVRRKKERDRGGFQDKIFLIDTSYE